MTPYLPLPTAFTNTHNSLLSRKLAVMVSLKVRSRRVQGLSKAGFRQSALCYARGARMTATERPSPGRPQAREIDLASIFAAQLRREGLRCQRGVPVPPVTGPLSL
jgi:hypothetical protein